MVLRELAEKHIPPIRSVPEEELPELRKDYYKKLGPFRKELESTHYDLEKELPGLIKLVSAKFPQSTGKLAGPHYYALAAVVDSITRDHLAKAMPEGPRHGKLIFKAHDNARGKPPAHIGKTVQGLREKLGDKTADSVSRMREAAMSLSGLMREKLSTRSGEAVSPEAGVLLDRFINSSAVLINFCGNVHRVLEERA
ncbi:MAG: hypothetical protein NTY90_03650 [Candidatus Micrarchaeota archaeon]|nr:hypothetical protein [Candidatus Micrarchaeota archaeon]